tara:strand:+ start:3226 stop:3480 length:255 start_codon:yes stop_codon:yes gene_type:complete
MNLFLLLLVKILISSFKKLGSEFIYRANCCASCSILVEFCGIVVAPLVGLEVDGIGVTLALDIDDLLDFGLGLGGAGGGAGIEM